MRCCEACFDDQFLKDHIRHIGKRGTTSTLGVASRSTRRRARSCSSPMTAFFKRRASSRQFCGGCICPGEARKSRGTRTIAARSAFSNLGQFRRDRRVRNLPPRGEVKANRRRSDRRCGNRLSPSNVFWSEMPDAWRGVSGEFAARFFGATDGLETKVS